MEFFNNIIKGLEVILVLYFSLTLNVLLKQEGERIKYWTFKINIPSSSNGRQINWMLTLRKVGIPSFEFEGSGMGSAYTDTKIQKIDSEFFGSNYLKFLYSAGSLYSQLGVCTPSNITLSESEQVFYIDIRLPTPPENN